MQALSLKSEGDIKQAEQGFKSSHKMCCNEADVACKRYQCSPLPLQVFRKVILSAWSFSD